MRFPLLRSTGWGRLPRFLLAGGIATLLHWLTMLILIRSGLNAVLATSMGAIVGLLANYVGQHRYAFCSGLLADAVIVYLTYTLRRYLHPERNSEAARLSGLWAALIYATMAMGFLTAGTVMTDSFLALGSTLVLTGLVVRLQGGPVLWGWLFFVGLCRARLWRLHR